MDIRQFFGGGGGVKKGTGNTKASPSKSKPSSSSKSPSPKKKQSPISPENKAKAMVIDSSSEEDKDANATITKKRQLASKEEKPAKKKIAVISDDEDYDDGLDAGALELVKNSNTVAKVSAKKKRTSAPPKAKEEDVKEPKPKKAKKSSDKKDSAFVTGLPLEGKTFVFSGKLNAYPDRDEAMNVVKELGGRVTSAVSGKTTYLVLGYELEDGRQPEQGSKYSKAQDKNVTILREPEFLEMVKDGHQKLPKVHAAATAATATSSSSSSSSTSSKLEVPKLALSDGTVKIDARLWVDKYKPKTRADLIGNTKMINDLSKWLQDWKQVHLLKTLKPKFNNGNVCKAALLSGPPGIGKTSAATLVAKDLGFEVMEMNASDARSKKLVASILGDAINSSSLSNTLSKASQNRLIIMDEVDGMSSDDRGGIQELIKIIKRSKVPIICICNDRQKSSVRSLANHCFDLKFQRPQARSMAMKMCEIAKSEGMTVDLNAMEQLVQAQNRDVRQVISALQMWQKSSDSLTFNDWRTRGKAVQKDDAFRLSTFDAARFMFNEATKPGQFSYRYDAYFIDYDLLPLMIAQQYPNAVQSSSRNGSSETATLEKLSSAADAVCDADILQRKVRGEQMWSLLPEVAAMNLRVTSVCSGMIGFPGFPEWLGKNSTRGKNNRLLSQTALHMRQRTRISTKNLRLDYMDTLRNQLIKPLVERDVDNIDKTVELMDAYGLDRDDVMENLKELRLGPGDPYISIDSKTKAAFTRTYNKGSHTSQLLVREAGLVGVTKKKSKKKASDDDEAENEDDEQEDADDDDDEDVKQLLASQQKKKAKKTPSKGKAKATKKKK